MSVISSHRPLTLSLTHKPKTHCPGDTFFRYLRLSCLHLRWNPIHPIHPMAPLSQPRCRGLPHHPDNTTKITCPKTPGGDVISEKPDWRSQRCQAPIRSRSGTGGPATALRLEKSGSSSRFHQSRVSIDSLSERRQTGLPTTGWRSLQRSVWSATASHQMALLMALTPLADPSSSSHRHHLPHLLALGPVASSPSSSRPSTPPSTSTSPGRSSSLVSNEVIPASPTPKTLTTSTTKKAISRQKNSTRSRSRRNGVQTGRKRAQHVCEHCNAQTSPAWRRGPVGWLCNRCGLKYHAVIKSSTRRDVMTVASILN